jgi:hypothetical protein
MLNPVMIARRATSISSTANNVVISLGARPTGHQTRKHHHTRKHHPPAHHRKRTATHQ